MKQHSQTDLPTEQILDKQNPVIEAKAFNAWFNDSQILKDINLAVYPQQINGIVGPSGSGKTTLLRCINRMNDDTAGFFTKGKLRHGLQAIYDNQMDATQLRKKIGMVFQKPCVFPRSIAENVLFGIERQTKLSKQAKANLAEEKLKAVGLWNEVKNRLQAKASTLSMGQQQRLCIARTLAVNPHVILMDEPTSSLDPVAARAIEELMLNLAKDYTIILVTHDILQAKRIVDHLIFLCNGQIIEQGDKHQLFDQPLHPQTRSYLNRQYCDC